MEIVAQVIGIIGMAFNVLSFNNKSAKTVIAFQFFGSLFFSINYFMLGAPVGALLNLFGIIRAIVFYNKERFKSESPIWIVAFACVYVAVYILSFTVFGSEATPKNLIIEVLPVLGSLVTTVSFRFKEARLLRRLGLISSPLWLTYNIVNLTIGGICCEALNFISIIVGMLRFDRGGSEGDNKDKV